MGHSPIRGIQCSRVPGTCVCVKGNVAVKSAADRYYAQGDHITYAICRLSSIISNHCSPPRTEHTTTIFRLNLFCNLVKKTPSLFVVFLYIWIISKSQRLCFGIRANPQFYGQLLEASPTLKSNICFHGFLDRTTSSWFKIYYIYWTHVSLGCDLCVTD